MNKNQFILTFIKLKFENQLYISYSVKNKRTN